MRDLYRSSKSNRNDYRALTFRDGRSAAAAVLLLERATHVDLAAYIFLRLEDDDVDLGRIEADKGDRGTQADRHTECRDLGLMGVPGAEVNWHEGEPDDACGVHGKADELALIEVFRNLARLHRIDGRDENQNGVVQLGEQETHVLDVALENHLPTVRIRMSGAGRLDDHPDQRKHHLRMKNNLSFSFSLPPSHSLIT